MATRKEETRSFGQALKRLRTEDARIGLRAFADLINMKPSNLSNMERGRTAPPANRKTIDQICDALGLPSKDPRRDELFDLAASASNRIPADVAEVIREQPAIPVLVRTVGNKQLGEEKIRELAEYIEQFY
jgi:transcriptional regulator with XRE-family HTH domain